MTASRYVVHHTLTHSLPELHSPLKTRITQTLLPSLRSKPPTTTLNSTQESLDLRIVCCALHLHLHLDRRRRAEGHLRLPRATAALPAADDHDCDGNGEEGDDDGDDDDDDEGRVVTSRGALLLRGAAGAGKEGFGAGDKGG